MNISRYQLLAQLRADTEAVVYRARDPRDDRLFEIRVLNGAQADGDRWKNLAKKLRLAAMLDHPGTRAVRELHLEHDPPYLVLDWLDGKTLAEELNKSVPLAVPQALSIVRDLAAVLAAAHRLGLVHGGLCPNRIRRKDGGTLQIDFTAGASSLDADRGSFSEVDVSCQAPEQRSFHAMDSAADIYSLGAILWWLLSGRPVQAGQNRADVTEEVASQVQRPAPLTFVQASPNQPISFQVLLQRMLAADPSERPLAQEAADTLGAVLDSHDSTARTPAAPRAVPRTEETRERLGRFRLLEKLGEGGLGAVYRGQDVTDGSVVAIKILQDHAAKQPTALRRLHKEARLLAEVNNPYVANLIELNEDDGIHYLVLEFVAGKSLSQLLTERHCLEEPLALSIMADGARGLADAHRRGIVHRDIKPGNILLVGPESNSEDRGSRGADAALRIGDSKTLVGTSDPRSVNLELGSPRSASISDPRSSDSPQSSIAMRVKLCDFGLARHVVESESLNVTQIGSVVGTALYMSPEQCAGNQGVDARSDVYGMGATLFHMLAGRPPFLGDSVLALTRMHLDEPPPPLQQFNRVVSDGVCQIVAKALDKNPDARYPDAEAFLQDLERLLHGEPTSIVVHPRLPACDARRLLQYEWSWNLDASPRQLWPYVSNTERLNHAVGLPAVETTAKTDLSSSDSFAGRPRVRRFVQFRKAGVTAAYEEQPFEWIEARRHGVLRTCSQGPFKWLVTLVDLLPRAGGGTTLTHRVYIEPHGLMGRLVAGVEVGYKGRRALDRVYPRIDAYLTGKMAAQPFADPFEEAASLSGARRQRLDLLLARLLECRVEPVVVERLGEFLQHAPAQEVARIRPLALARRLGLDPDQVLSACLHGAHEGLLVLLWDILCPVCRIPSEVQDSLRAVRDHAHCEICSLDFELDFANSVEMIFRVHPAIRNSELGTYCIGGPAHSPHVVAQVRVGTGERIEMDLELGEGNYRLRGPQLPYKLDFRVEPSASLTRWELNLVRGPDAEGPRSLKSGRQLLVLTNDHAQELLVRVERTAPRDDAMTAARASALSLFRELFPGEILSPGQLVSVSALTFLVTELDEADALYDELGEVRAFGIIQEHFRTLNDAIRHEGGALVKTVGEGVLAVFSDPVAAVRAGVTLQAMPAKGGSASGKSARNARLRLGIHRGPTLAATLNDHLDYQGTTVRRALRLLQFARAGELVLTAEVASDPGVAAWLRAKKMEGEIVPADLPGQPQSLVHRLAPPAGAAV